MEMALSAAVYPGHRVCVLTYDRLLLSASVTRRSTSERFVAEPLGKPKGIALATGTAQPAPRSQRRIFLSEFRFFVKISRMTYCFDIYTNVASLYPSNLPFERGGHLMTKISPNEVHGVPLTKGDDRGLRILGIDPGFGRTGIGVVDMKG